MCSEKNRELQGSHWINSSDSTDPCISIYSIQQRQHSWRTTRLAEQTRYSMFRVHHFNDLGLQRSRTSAIILVKRQGTFSIQEYVQRRVGKPANTPRSRFQPEESRSRFQVQPGDPSQSFKIQVPVMRQQAESSSIEACTYLNSSVINSQHPPWPT
jgi:hypothetical protein